ncbi:MAG: hypothetical protein AB1473_12225 [Thermodesulfobacteriota bacterium]
MAHLAVRIAFCALVVVAAPSGVKGEMLPWNMTLDAALRMNFFIGEHVAIYDPNPPAEAHPYRLAYNPRLLVFSGVCEVSPVTFLSGRLGGSLSVNPGGFSYFHTTGVANPLDDFWEMRPEYKSWEVAGLLHLWSELGYRFSFVGGYREDFWIYRGQPQLSQGAEAQWQDEFVHRIPFIGLQTAAFFPWWKARFEVIGSWFVNEKMLSRFDRTDTFLQYESKLDNGGFIQLEAQGNVALTPAIWLGLYARYSYLELFGLGNRTRPDGIVYYQTSLDENVGVIGLDLTILY